MGIDGNLEEMEFKLSDEYITLQSLLKAAGLVETGGAAKAVIVDGEVKVDGAIEVRRGKKIRAGQRVSYQGQEIWVTS